MKNVFIAEKPSVAKEFAKVLNVNGKYNDGYIEDDNNIVTWCVGHLVTMSYPESYDEKYKKWDMNNLPFIPDEFKYEIIDNVKKQFNIVKKIINRNDVDTIYVCTDSGREGEYIYRLVEQEAGTVVVNKKRVWIDSQTYDEIKRGIKEAKPLSSYDNLKDSAYLRAIEDYLMGINFSRALTLKFGYKLSKKLNEKYIVIACGRVMSCTLNMIVEREREIRNFKKVKFYKVFVTLAKNGKKFDAMFKVNENSKFFGKKFIYKDFGFLDENVALDFVKELNNDAIDNIGDSFVIKEINIKKEKKQPPFLYNLAEIQNECSKKLKISPDETLNIIQDLYEKKFVTYPRTDARVLSTAIAKEIDKNIRGLLKFQKIKPYVEDILENKKYEKILKTKYVDDKKITDHYAIIPTGVVNDFMKLNEISRKVYVMIVKRFLAIFLENSEYKTTSIVISKGKEIFKTSNKTIIKNGFMVLYNSDNDIDVINKNDENDDDLILDFDLSFFKKGDILNLIVANTKESDTKPSKRYTSGTIILAMENAGNYIEDENLRSTIKKSGIGTSATRSEILKKLISKKYIQLNKKTQVLTPTVLGEDIVDIMKFSLPSLLNPILTASWEKGLDMVANGELTTNEYMDKLKKFIISKVLKIKN